MISQYSFEKKPVVVKKSIVAYYTYGNMDYSFSHFGIFEFTFFGYWCNGFYALEPRTWKCCKCRHTNYDNTNFVCADCGHHKCNSCILQG